MISREIPCFCNFSEAFRASGTIAPTATTVTSVPILLIFPFPMGAVSRDKIVVFCQGGCHPYGHRFLPDGQVNKPGDLTFFKKVSHAFLKKPDFQHAFIHCQFLLICCHRFPRLIRMTIYHIYKTLSSTLTTCTFGVAPLKSTIKNCLSHSEIFSLGIAAVVPAL